MSFFNSEHENITCHGSVFWSISFEDNSALSESQSLFASSVMLQFNLATNAALHGGWSFNRLHGLLLHHADFISFFSEEFVSTIRTFLTFCCPLQLRDIAVQVSTRNEMVKKINSVSYCVWGRIPLSLKYESWCISVGVSGRHNH